MALSGQLWYITEGQDADTRLVRIHDDGTHSTIINDNGGLGTGDNDFPSSAVTDIGVDTATGFYFAIANTASPLNYNAFLVRGRIDGSVTPVTVVDFNPDNIIVNTIEVDPINRKIYVGVQDDAAANGAITGIRIYTYTAAGVVTDAGFLTTANTDNRPDVSGNKILDPFDFAIDHSIGRLFYSDSIDNLTSGLWRLDLASPNTHIQMTTEAQFPVDLTSGQIMDVEVDVTTDLVYFTTRSRHPSPLPAYDADDNALWYISSSATNDPATKVTLTGMPGGNVFYGGDMAFDQSTRQIYLESSESSPGADNVIYVFQLDGAGTTASLIRTINVGLTITNAVIEGMDFVDVAALSVSGTATAPTEQAASATTLLTSAPTITDTDGGYLIGATVRITGGTFSSNENSTNDDHLGFGVGKQISGTIASTSITVSWNAATETLTLAGYDTIAHYQTALAGLVYWATGDNPTNYGANTSRTLTWTINDGTPGLLDPAPDGAVVNIGTTLINLAAANDAPVNIAPAAASGNAGVNIAVTGLQVSDVDANPATATITVNLSAANGVLTLLTNVGGGLVAGDVAGNGTGSVTVTGTINKINLTLAAANGLVYLSNPAFSGTDTLTVVTNDAGATGSGGALSDTDGYAITVIGPNAAPVVVGTGVLLAAVNEDTAAPAGQTVASVFGSAFSDTNGGDTLAGVAITGNAVTSQGIWQYFNGAWTTIGAPTEAAALALAAGTLVRFLPAANFNGAVPALTAYLIDSSGGVVAPGAILNVSVNGGITRFSDVSTTLGTSITAVNDTPAVPASAVTVGATEQTPVTLLASLTVSDVDLDARNAGNGDYGGASFTVQRAAANAQDTFLFVAGGLFGVSGSSLQAGGLGFATFTNAGGVLTINFTSAATTATTALVNDVITHIRYVNASDAPPSSVTLTYGLNDGAPGGGQGAGTSTASGSVIVNITAVDDIHTGGASITGTAAEDQVLTAVSTLVDPDGLGTLHYQWQRDIGGGFVNVGADQATYTLGDGDIGGVVRVVIYYTDAGGTVESATSASTAIVSASNDAPTGGVSITGTQTENQVLTANTATLADSDGLGTLHYQWQRNTGSGFVDVVGPDQATYTLGDADYASLIRVVVSYTDGQGFANSVTSSSTSAISGVNDPHTGGASITGTPTQGQALTAVSTLADIDGVGALHYTWQHDVGGGYVNVGTDQATYTLGSADVGGIVRVVISYTDGQNFAESATSVSTASISNINDAPTGGVSITGTQTENQVLTANTAGLVDPDGLGTFHYQWQRNTGSGFVNVVGPDQATYTLGDADYASLIRVVVSYTDQQGTAESVTSTSTSAISGVNDPHTGGASITGTPTENQVLTAVSTLADIDGLGTLHYQWQHDVGGGYVNVGADQATYTLGDSDVGGIVRVVISYTDGQNFAESATSVSTASISGINDPHTGGASIAGSPAEDQVLTAVSTLADDDGLGTLHFQWQRDTGSGFVNVGADQATYTLGDGDIGGVVRVVIYYTDAGGTVESATSASTAIVSASNDAPTGGVSITGTQTENQVLTANTATLADSDGLGTLHYQWQRNTGSGFVDVVGPDQATYTLGDADYASLIRVVVSYTDGQGFANSVTSSSTSAISGVNDPHTGGASITGTPTQGQALTAVSTLADIDGVGALHYTWQHDVGGGYVNVGTDQATYTLGSADVGGIVRVVISYTDGQNFAESATSVSTASISNINDAPTGGVSITGTQTENQVLTANTAGLVDPDGLGTFHYQWQRNTGSGFVNVVGPDQATYTLGDADYASLIRVVVSYTDQQGTAESVTSTSTSAISGVNDPHTGGASITGTPTENQVLTAVSTLADIDGLGTLHYQWQHDVGGGYVNVGADQATYTLGDSDVGGIVRVVISYTDGQNFAESATSVSTASISNINDAPTGAVVITGTVSENEVLTADTSTLADDDGLGTLHFQWQRDTGSGFVNVGADQATYTLGAVDVGGVVRAVVNYTDQHGTAESSASAVTAAVLPANNPHTGGASITGTPTEDQVLTAASSLVDADGLGALHYQWQHDVGSGYVNVGTDQSTYTLGDADVGGIVRLTISYTDGVGHAESATSVSTASISNVNDAPTGTVSIAGTVTENQVLTADTAALVDLDGLGTLHYQWQRDTGSGFVDVGTDQVTYTLGDADVGGVIRAVVSYVDNQGTAEAFTSSATAAVTGANDPHTGGASITGTPTEHQVLTAVSTLADTDGLGTLHYQWQHDVGSGYVNVGTDQVTYTLGDGDAGGVVRVVLSYTDGQGFSESATSASTAAIANVNDAPTGSVTITGTPTLGQTLTASNNLADADGMGVVGYQWYENGAPIGGATGATLLLDAARAGKSITVRANYTDDFGTAESVISAATAAVTAAPPPPPPPGTPNNPPGGNVTIAGTPTQGQTLTASNSLTDANGLGAISYQWRQDGVVIAGAIAATLVLTQAQVGHAITVTASYTDALGNNETMSSAATAAVLNVNDAPTGVVMLAGPTTVGANLTAANTLADIDGLGPISYQWLRDGADIGGASGATYQLLDADIGHAVTVRASYVDGFGAHESVVSTNALVATPGTTINAPITPGASQASVDGQRFDTPRVSDARITLIADALDGHTDPDPGTATIVQFSQSSIVLGDHGVLDTLGMVRFTVDLSSPGVTETFSYVFDSALPQNGYWVLDQEGHWTNLATAGEHGASVTVGGQARLDFQITDGGEFDLDGLVNGSITSVGIVADVDLSLIGHIPDTGGNFGLF